jgi:transcriptional regulator with XRE-family HTH domain
MKTKKYSELRAKMSSRAKEFSDNFFAKDLEEAAINQLREALHLTQEQLAESLNISQVAVSRMERRSDMFVSTLRRIVEAMGGELEIHAVFPSGTVRLHRLGELHENAAAAARR